MNTIVKRLVTCLAAAAMLAVPLTAYACEPGETEKDMTVCDFASMSVITIKESAFDSSKYSTDTASCKKPEPKMIKVCDLASKTIVTIDEKTFDAVKHSKDLAACAKVEVEQPKMIKVCDLASKTIVTIDEKTFDAVKHSKDGNVCTAAPLTPAAPTTPPAPAAPAAPQLQTPAVLPNTGSGAVAAIFGITSVLGTVAYRFALRLNRA